MVWKTNKIWIVVYVLELCIHFPFLEILTDKLLKSSQLYKDIFPFYKMFMLQLIINYFLLSNIRSIITGIAALLTR